MRRRYYIMICLFSLLLSGCSLFHAYQVKIQQGNIITQKMIDQLRPGMTSQQVEFILGAPVLVNTFSETEFNYVYTYQIGYDKISEKKLTLYFRNGVLHHYTSAGVKHPFNILRPRHRRKLQHHHQK